MISILSKAATWPRDQLIGETFSRVFNSRLRSAQLIWTAVVHDLDHLREAAAEPRQLADQQAVAGLERRQHFVDAALERTLARRDAGLDESIDRESAFLAELEDRQLLVGEVLRTSGDTEVGDGFQGGVQEKVKWGLFRSVKDYSIRNIV